MGGPVSYPHTLMIDTRIEGKVRTSIVKASAPTYDQAWTAMVGDCAIAEGVLRKLGIQAEINVRK